jgi:hypothetical protein
MNKISKRTTRTISPRIAEDAAKWYGEQFENTHQGVTYALEAFPVLYRRTLAELKGRFSRGELMLICDVSNGLILTPMLAGQHLDIQVEDSIALDGTDRKWEIDGKQMIEKINALSAWERACLEIWGRAFWESDAFETDPEGYVRAMIGAGAPKEG